MDQVLILRFYTCLEEDYAKNIRNNLLGIANLTFQQVFECATAKYGKTTATHCTENRNRMIAKWNPSDGTTRL